jgi:predicted ribosome quality control (RQC) complex YloA/Tae2 family protein
MNYQTVQIPVAPEAAKAFRKALKKKRLTATEVTKKDKTLAFDVYFSDPADLYHLGLHVMGELMNDFFPHL